MALEYTFEFIDGKKERVRCDKGIDVICYDKNGYYPQPFQERAAKFIRERGVWAIKQMDANKVFIGERLINPDQIRSISIEDKF